MAKSHRNIAQAKIELYDLTRSNVRCSPHQKLPITAKLKANAISPGLLS